MGAPAQRDFRFGKLAPSFYGRADLGLYGAGLKEARNVYVKRMGGITSRPGTLYKGTTKSNGAVVLVDAVFDTDENYVLEFGNQYLRVWKDGDLVSVGTPSAWVTATAYVKGNVRSNGGTNYVCIVAHTSGTFATDLAAGKWYALTDDIFEYPTDYTTAQLSALQFAVQYHAVTIVHPAHPPAMLTWLSNASWELSDIDFTAATNIPENVAVSGTAGTGWGYTVAARFFEDGAFTRSQADAFVRTNLTNASLTSLVFSGLSVSPRTITWDAVSGAVSYSIYLNRGDGSPVYRINTTDDSTSYVDNGTAWLTAPIAAPEVADSVFDAAGEYPAVVAAYQQRLLLAAASDTPDVVYASQPAAPENFNTSDPLEDSDSLSWRQVGQRLNRIRFFAEVAQRLVQFSSVGESIVQGDTDGILRPGEVNPRLVSQNGITENVPPLVIGDSILYVQARGNQVMDLWPDGSGSEISRTAWDLLDGYEVVSWCFQRTPDRVVWAVRDDGKLLSLTYSREDQIVGWAWHDTDGNFERVVCVPEGDEDAVYAVVNRTIDGGTVRYVERFADRLADTPVCMDAAITVTL